MGRRNVKKVISMVLVLLMSFSSMAFAAGGDYAGHWAEDSIQSWIDKGYVRGYADGSFKPENDITRAEFISIVNRSFGFTEKAEVTYKDVANSHWAYDEFTRAAAAGYIGGFEDGTLRPNSKITRQEMASIITRLLGLSAAKDSDAFLDLSDVDAIPEWSAGAVSALVNKGYIKLRDGNSFAPTLPATRAEVIDALNKGYLSIVKVKYDEAGTYTAGVVDGSVEINAADVTLEDTIINGDLVIGEAVGSGDVTLNNVTVKGNTIVKGGGMNTITINNSQIKNLIVEKKDGKVRILAKGDTYVNNVEMKSGGKLESSDSKANNFGYVVIAENISSNEPIILAGNFASVEVKSGKNEIKVLSGTIKNLEIAKTAKDAKVNLAEGVKVETLEVNAPAKIDGKGKIETAKVNVNDVVITAPVEKMEVAEGVTKPETTPITPGGGGGGGGGSTRPPVTTGEAITITITTVSAINGIVTVSFDKAVTEVPKDLTITVGKEVLELKASVVGGKVEITVPKITAPQEGVTEVTYAVTLDKVTKTVTLKVTAMTENVPEDKKDADEFTAILKNVSATVGVEVTIAELEAGITNLPEGATTNAVAFTPDVVGDVTRTITITFADESTKDVDVKVVVAAAADTTTGGVIDLTTSGAAIDLKTSTGGAITFTSGAAIDFTSGTAIEFTTSGGAIEFTTSDGAITFTANDGESGSSIAYKINDSVETLPAKITGATEVTEVTKIEVKGTDKWLTFYEINADNQVISYINIQLIFSEQ